MKRPLLRQGLAEPGPTGDPALPPPGSHVYLLGICGTGMAALAGLLREQGYWVSGSDSQAYPPMSDLLARLGIPIALGYDPVHLDPPPDLVIIGNVIRRENPEAQAVLSRGLRHLSFPQALAQLCLTGRSPLVVAGTHGKTTTASLLVSALTGAGEDPGFMIGGVVRTHGTGFSLGRPPWFVLEGDEYDTAFFDKGPKFLHYRPQAVILTSLEFDHADIYPNLDALKSAFSRLVGLLPAAGTLVACSDWPAVLEVSASAPCRVVTYGSDAHADWRIGDLVIQAGGTRFRAIHRSGASLGVSLAMPGRHNALNALAVVALGRSIDIPPGALQTGLSACRGVKRRQEVRGEVAGVTVIDDFAHHPTAVRETLAALKAVYGPRRLIAVFEPRTNTSRRRVFQGAYAQAFGAADRVLVREVPDPEKAPPDDRFSSRQLVADLVAQGRTAQYFPDAAAILEEVLRIGSPGDVVVILSNGAFEGLHNRLLAALDERST